MIRHTTRIGRATGVLAVLFCLFLAPSSAQSTKTLLPFTGATGWLNSPALTPEALRGKVVLVDFWEYTCINCLRTLPYIEEWNKRYKDDGLVIVGIHTPEFGFSADPKNVEAATKRLGVSYPVALDANYDLWKAYDSDEWPNEFLFDQNGNLVEETKGEGGYQTTEHAIQRLLLVSHPTAKYPPVMALLPRDNYTKPGAVCYLGTGETYVIDKTIANHPETDGYHDPGNHTDGDPYLNGQWAVSNLSATSSDQYSSEYLAMKYHAMQVVAVMRPRAGSADMTVTEDGNPVPRGDAGADIQYDGHGRSFVTVDAARAYELIMNEKFGPHDLQLTPNGPGLSVYSFAFESCEQGSDK